MYGKIYEASLNQLKHHSMLCQLSSILSQERVNRLNWFYEIVLSIVNAIRQLYKTALMRVAKDRIIASGDLACWGGRNRVDDLITALEPRPLKIKWLDKPLRAKIFSHSSSSLDDESRLNTLCLEEIVKFYSRVIPFTGIIKKLWPILKFWNTRLKL